MAAALPHLDLFAAANALADLALSNFIEMRDHTGSWWFRTKKRCALLQSSPHAWKSQKHAYPARQPTKGSCRHRLVKIAIRTNTRAGIKRTIGR